MAEKQFAENVKYTLVLNNNTLLRGNFLPSESGGRDLRFDLGVDSFNGEIYASALDWRYFGQSGLLVLSAKTGNVTHSISLPADGSFGGMAFDSQDREMYIGGFNNSDRHGFVLVIDTKSHSIIESIDIHSNTAPGQIVPDPFNGYLYVTSGDNVSVIDGSTNRFVKNIEIPGSSLIDITYDPQNRYLYVSDDSANSIVVMDSRSSKIIGSIKVGNYPGSVVFDRLNELVYVSCLHEISIVNASSLRVIGSLDYQYSSYLAVDKNNGLVYVDGGENFLHFPRVSIIKDERIIGSFQVIGYGAFYLAFNEFNNRLYVMGSNIVIEVNPATNRVVNDIYVAFNPTEIAVDRSHRSVFVLESDSQSISVINTSTNLLVRNTHVGADEEDLTFNPDNGDLYVSRAVGGYKFQPMITVVNPIDGKILRSIKLGNPLKGPEVSPMRMAYDHYNKYLYVASGYGCRVGECFGPSNVFVVDTKSNNMVKEIRVPPSGYPVGIAFDSADDYIYTTNIVEPCHGPPACLTSNVSVIDGRTNNLVKNILINGDARNIGFDPSNGLLYVTNGSNVLTILNATSKSISGYIVIANSSFVGYEFGSMEGIMAVSSFDSGQIAFIGSSNNVLELLTVGDGPSGVAGDEAAGYFYLGNEYSGTLSLIA